MNRNSLIVAAALLAVNSTAVVAMGGPNGGPNLPSPNYDFRTPSAEKVELGRVLMFDKILSGVTVPTPTSLGRRCGRMMSSLGVNVNSKNYAAA